MRSPQGVDYWCRGQFTEIVPFDRLAIAMRVIGEGDRRYFSAHTLVTFAEDAGGTRMEIVQTYTLHDAAGLPMIEGAAAGWNETDSRGWFPSSSSGRYSKCIVS